MLILNKISVYFGLLTMLQFRSIKVYASENLNNNFKSFPTTIKTFETDTVLLPCNHKAPINHVRWLREESLLVDSRYPSLIVPERVHLWENGSLEVSNVKHEDTGDYKCEIMTNEGVAHQWHAIEIQVGPTVKSTPSGVVEVDVGKIFEMVCEPTGIPYPAITWRIKGEENSAEVSRRRLIQVTDKDAAGLIECIASNGVGEPAVAGLNLIVLFTPEVMATKSVVHTKIGLRALLECHVIAQPLAKVHWFHRGVPLLIDNIKFLRHEIDLNANKSIFHYNTRITHQLIIKNLRDTDLGQYECKAENKIGYTGALIELTGKPMPPVFKTSPITASSVTNYNLIWQTESLSPINEYKLKFRQVPSGNITPSNSRSMAFTWNELTIPVSDSDSSLHSIGYTLRGLLPGNIYEAAVLARNRYGWSDLSKIVRFATDSEIGVEGLTSSTKAFDNELQQDQYTTEPSYYTSLMNSGNILKNNTLSSISLYILLILQRIFEQKVLT